MSDVEYTVAARMNLGLQPLPSLARTMLPPDCPLCKRRVSLDTDPWHWLPWRCSRATHGRRVVEPSRSSRQMVNQRCEGKRGRVRRIGLG